MEKISKAKLWWIAALIEGEGCITRQVTTKRSQEYKYWLVTVSSTDYDVLDRLLKWTKAGAIYKQKVVSGKKLYWQWRVYRQPEVLWLLKYILPIMCKRRTTRIQEAIGDLDGRIFRKGRRRTVIGVVA